MTQHPFLDAELAERAALYVLGSLPDDEARAFRLHSVLCQVCANEIAALQRLGAELALAAPRATPSPQLWQRIAARLHESDSASAPSDPRAGAGIQVWKRWNVGATSAERAPDGLTLVSGQEQGFQPTAIEGIHVKQLFVDALNDRATMLVRMAPGTSYPAHRHGGPEECYVLEGDISVAGQRMHAGDYQRAEHGSEHGVQATENGCLLLIVSSLRDELT